VNPDPQANPKSPLKNPLLYSSVLVLVVAAYVGYVLLDRHLSLRRIERRAAEAQSEQRRDDDRRAIEQLGGSELSIRALYVSPAIVHAGEIVQLCYDVSKAKTVTLDPAVAEVWPSHTRCIDLMVKKSTTYTLTITGADGKTISQAVELIVH
jgi:hypothetical protein